MEIHLGIDIPVWKYLIESHLLLIELIRWHTLHRVAIQREFSNILPLFIETKLLFAVETMYISKKTAVKCDTSEMQLHQLGLLTYKQMIRQLNNEAYVGHFVFDPRERTSGFSSADHLLTPDHNSSAMFLPSYP